MDEHGNEVVIGDNLKANVIVNGKRNRVILEGAVHPSTITVNVSGDDNEVLIHRLAKAASPTIWVGNHVQAHGASVVVKAGLNIATGCEFFVYNSLNVLRIGENCLFSRDIIIRCGESPHLLFDYESGDYLDISEGVFIGDHVWVGERAYITKRATIPDESMVAACAVVTKRFEDPRVVLAGNPAKVVRSGVQWHQNYSFLPTGSKFRQSWVDRKSNDLAEIAQRVEKQEERS